MLKPFRKPIFSLFGAILALMVSCQAPSDEPVMESFRPVKDVMKTSLYKTIISGDYMTSKSDFDLSIYMEQIKSDKLILSAIETWDIGKKRRSYRFFR